MRQEIGRQNGSNTPTLSHASHSINSSCAPTRRPRRGRRVRLSNGSRSQIRSSARCNRSFRVSGANRPARRETRPVGSAEEETPHPPGTSHPTNRHDIDALGRKQFAPQGDSKSTCSQAIDRKRTKNLPVRESMPGMFQTRPARSSPTGSPSNITPLDDKTLPERNHDSYGALARFLGGID